MHGLTTQAPFEVWLAIDVIRLFERQTGGVQALKNLVGVLAVNRDDDQGKHCGHGVRKGLDLFLRIGGDVATQRRLKEAVGADDLVAPRSISGSTIDHGEENLTIADTRDDLVPRQPLLSLLDEVSLLDVLGDVGESMLPSKIAKNSENDCYRCEPLLAVDQLVVRRFARHVADRSTHQRPHEVLPRLRIAQKGLQIIPKPLPIRQLPRVVALEERNEKAISGVEDVTNRLCSCVHSLASLSRNGG